MKTIAQLKTLINVARSQLSVDDETYRAKLMALTGKDSLRSMSQIELNSVYESFKKSGFKPKPQKPQYRVQPNADGKPAVEEIAKIRAIWHVMHEQGFIENGSEIALNAYVQRMTASKNGGAGVAEVGWLNPKLAERVLESLKKWHLRLIKGALTKRRIRHPQSSDGVVFNYYAPFAELYSRICAHDQYMNELIDSGAHIVSCSCPACGFRQYAKAPVNHDIWHSICRCPACNAVYQQWVKFNNVLTSYKPQGAK